MGKPPLRLGVAYDFRNPPESGLSHQALYAAIMDQVAWLDGLGLDLVWFTEHHFVEDSYLPSFVPVVDFWHVLSYVFAAAMAGRSFAEGWPVDQRWIQAAAPLRQGLRGQQRRARSARCERRQLAQLLGTGLRAASCAGAVRRHVSAWAHAAGRLDAV